MQTRFCHINCLSHGISDRNSSCSTFQKSDWSRSRRLMSAVKNIMFCCVALCLTASSLWAQGPEMVGSEAPTSSEPIIKLDKPTVRINMIETFTKVVELKQQILRVDGFDPNVLQVTAITPNQIRLQAMSQGVTQVTLTDENEKVYNLEIYVEGDVRYLQAMINDLFPDSAVRAIKVSPESIVLRGFVAKPEQITRIVDVAEQFFPIVINQMDFGGEQQIKLKIIVMEVQRAKLRKFGFNFLLLGENGYFASTPGQLTPLASLTSAAGSAPAAAVRTSALADSTLTFGVVRPDTIFNGFLEALKKESLLKIYSNTELVASNGRPASLLAGGEFPILVPQSLGTVSVEYRPFGTSLEAVPILLGNGRLRLELQPEVSETDFANAVTLSGTTVPAITTRRVNTQVEMNFGQTLVIAGLLSNRDKAETHKVPFLGELPYIGAAFRREQYDEGETEVIIMVTPEVVGPLSSEEVPPGGPGRFTTTPTDRELYMDGMLEVPNYGDMCSGCEAGCVSCQAGVSGRVISSGGPDQDYRVISEGTVIEHSPIQNGTVMPGPGPEPVQMLPSRTYQQPVPNELPPVAPPAAPRIPDQTSRSQMMAPSNSLIQPSSGMIQPVSGTVPPRSTPAPRRPRTANGLIAPGGN
ncbi:Type II secretion system protein D precursor [Polystyrenella longa]|uniref:Type II secretion system protein D n=1 Tax=Polystyrenella longa TaxID=2528007 RepID=A0A518CSN5_9PLAN|nr:pilus assembly protein N-terminal domain-containing protein [Polystyrenella longa]QDU82242.1 Type II secretion system protein D precursor [Polystyrenella longa]